MTNTELRHIVLDYINAHTPIKLGTTISLIKSIHKEIDSEVSTSDIERALDELTGAGFIAKRWSLEITEDGKRLLYTMKSPSQKKVSSLF